MKHWYYYRAGRTGNTPLYCRVTANGSEQPWPTLRELQRDCRNNGVRAIIFDTEPQAREAFVKEQANAHQ